MDHLKYQIALSLVPGVGCITARNLLAYFGDPQAVFQAKESRLMKVPGVGRVLAANIGKTGLTARAEKEIAFLERYKIRSLFLTDEHYPVRLKECPDAPLILFMKGNFNPDGEKMVAVVGTRHATENGREFCETLIRDMASRGGYTVISGLAYGIDVAAHRACLQYGVPTIGVLGHGLDRIYPGQHRSVAERMLVNGGLVSEFVSETEIDRSNFVRRNRIIAGMADAVVVVESAVKGGALISADLASSYHRDVFAVPGRVTDQYARGCNALIKQNQAALIENLADLEYFMSWQTGIDLPAVAEAGLFADLMPEEQALLDVFQQEMLSIDDLCQLTEMPARHLAALLLELELKGVVKALPGKMYKVNR